MKAITSLITLLLFFSLELSAQLNLKAISEPSKEVQLAVDSIFNSLTTRQRVGQMVFLAAGSNGRKEADLLQLLKDDLAGGIIFLGGTADEFKVLKKGFDTLAHLPLIYSIDAEPSLMQYKLKNIQTFAKTNTLKDSAMMDSAVNVIDSHLMDLGVTVNYAPVCDLTPENEVIGHRSLGKNVDSVVWLSEVFMRRSLSHGILPVIKHFPGHGNVEGDSHKKLVYINGDFKELDVFSKMIALDAPCVMVGHIAIRNNPYASEMPATCSKLVVTDLLRDSLGFKGLVITDALNMGAVSNIDGAGFLAMEAGCDIVLMPLDVEDVVNRAIEKIKEDDDFALQIEASVKRILTLKYQQGLVK